MIQSTARFDLLLSLVESGRELSGTLEYSSDLFDPTTVERLLGHYRTLLANLVADPEGRIWDLALMAAHYLDQLRAVQPRGPYQLAGWSFGGLVAYEMARQLVAAGEAVASLVLIDAGAPVAAEEPPDAAIYDDDALWLADVGNFVARLAGGEPPVSYEELRELARDQQVPTFVARMPALGWSRLSSRAVEVHTLPGDHLTLFGPENLEALAER
ncbi:MAG: hypothetical protein GY856_40065, partial [bacterium]|nr:hypothetical protein [bacterium]